MAKYKQKYSPEDLENALSAVKEGRLSQKGASRVYNVPRATLILKLKGWKSRKTTSVDCKLGRPVELGEEVEQKLADHIKTMSRWGFGLTRKEIITLVATYVQKNHIKNRFKAGIPGKDWFSAFSHRHRLSCKKPSKRQIIRSEQTKPEIIYGFFDLLENTVTKLNLVQKPHLIFNIDETSVCHDPVNTKVVSEKNKSVFRHTAGTGRTNTSILHAISADGNKLPPFIIHKAKHLWDVWMSPRAYPGTGYAVSDNGWMTSSVFLNWFQHHFLKHCPDERPIVIIMDGHTSHISIDVINLAKENSITLLKLPPHTTHILQPLDSMCFSTYKKYWDEELVRWQRENYGRSITKAEIAELTGIVWEKIPEITIKKGFRVTGIYDDRIENPVNRKAIKESVFMPSDLKEYQERMQNQIPDEDSTEANIPQSQEIGTVANTSTRTATGSSPEAETETPVAASSSSTPNPSISFEELLLKKISRTTATPQKRRKVTSHAEILTSTKNGALASSSSSSSASSLQLDDESEAEAPGITVIEGDFIAVSYDERQYPGKVLEVDEKENRVRVSHMIPSGIKAWRWPQKEDVLWYSNEEIIKIIKPPKAQNNRGLYSVPEVQHEFKF